MFFDPHPGYLGAVIPLPVPIKRIVDDLVGEGSLEASLARLRTAAETFAGANGALIKVEARDWISLRLGSAGGLPQHVFRLIRFRR